MSSPHDEHTTILPRNREPTPEPKAVSKQKSKSSVTPRTFRRFFTPRKPSREEAEARIKKRDALCELTPSGINSRKRPLRFKSANRSSDEATPSNSPNPSIWENTKSSPAWPNDDCDISPVKRVKTWHHVSAEIFREVHSDTEDSAEEEAHDVRPVRQSRYRSSLGDCLRRQVGDYTTPVRKSTVYINANYDTAGYFSGPDDVYRCQNLQEGQAHNVIPFCSAACNTNSLVAVGDEEGAIKLLDTSPPGPQQFHKPLLTFQAHNNALLDLQFSTDDRLLATASGDQACQVIDMLTQKAVYVLKGHTSSVKQIKFQPGSNEAVLATSSRDGSVQMWDLRCNMRSVPSMQLEVSMNGVEEDQITTMSGGNFRFAGRVNLINDAHCTTSFLSTQTSMNVSVKYTERRTQPLQSRSEPSVTALSFLSSSNPHIILTGADSQASVKVWDIRTKHSHRGQATPISTTALPNRHNRYRHFGLTSMTVSGDGSRLYTLCKDNTVYVYSTAHLTLGGGQELYNDRIKVRRGEPEKTGLGPLYGFRHPKIAVSSFYVKLALRKARENVSEMLAVGSSNACAVLFPTDERSFMSHGSQTSENSWLRDRWQFSPIDNELEIYTHGTALVGGHEKEVTNVSWTSEGKLVTLGDDTRCRVWNSDNSTAMGLRKGGETSGQRWGHGWAEITNEEWDDSD